MKQIFCQYICIWVRLFVYNCVYKSVCVSLRVRIHYVRLCVHVNMCCAPVIVFFCQWLCSLKLRWKVSFKTFILLGLQLILISFFGLKTICTILTCCIMPTENKLLIIIIVITIEDVEHEAREPRDSMQSMKHLKHESRQGTRHVGHKSSYGT